MIEGTIIKGVGGQYTVDTPQGQYVCNARGLFRKQKITPIVGDRVQINFAEDRGRPIPGSEPAGSGTLMAIMPRRNELRRPKVANVDQVVVVLAVTQPPLSFALLDRYLIQAEYEGIEASICINKIDLDDVLPAEIKDIYVPIGYPVFAVSANSGDGLQDLKEFFQGKTTVLAGPSGVGKSSIINGLIKEKKLATGPVSERIGRGKHTTRHTEFVPISVSGYVIDTPGFSSLDPPDVPLLERGSLFREFRTWLGQCKFRDCLHKSEQGCAIIEQIGLTVDRRRYARYLEWISGK